jgi:secondary thiamine-phosphate synthase enzyme
MAAAEGARFSHNSPGKTRPLRVAIQGHCMIRQITVHTRGQGLHECTEAVQAAVRDSGVREGLCTLFIQHTSASLVVQENADPSARRDLERWLARLVPERDTLYSHVTEGPDDMPAHIKAALTATSLSVPVTGGRLGLGTWQGIFVWEHRHDGGERRLLLHIGA